MYSDKTYTNKALIPFWVIHLVFLFIFIAILAVDMMEVAGDIGYEPPYVPTTILQTIIDDCTNLFPVHSQPSCSSSA
jgi:hypothetical protein